MLHSHDDEGRGVCAGAYSAAFAIDQRARDSSRRMSTTSPHGDHGVSRAPVSNAIALSVVCAALSPSRKSLSLYVENRSVG